MQSSLIKIENLSLSFPDHHVLNNLSLDIKKGEFLAVIGENGVGKTTLVRILLKQLRPSSGKIIMPDDLRIGYVPQFRNIDVDYPLSVRDFVSLSFTGFKFPWLSKTEKKRLNEVISEVKLNNIEKRPLGLASGGEKQKAYLASALVKHPQLLILDESTASWDPKTKHELLDVVVDINKKFSVTILFVSHDLKLVSEYPDHYLWLQKGNYESGKISDLPRDVKEGINV